VKDAWRADVKARFKRFFTIPVEIIAGEKKLVGKIELASSRKGKGCDIGYALAASSCEGANSVDACTVTAL
jgi:hypothetical protein